MSDRHDNPQVKSYQDLTAWKKAMELAVGCYELSRNFPKDEMYGMTSQLRRATVSVAANIAEGYGRDTPPAFINFLRIAQGSAKEAETHLILCERVGLAKSEYTAPLLKLADEVARILRGLIRSLNSKLEQSKGA